MVLSAEDPEDEVAACASCSKVIQYVRLWTVGHGDCGAGTA